MTIINADIHTMSGKDYPAGYITFKDGKILAVGPMSAWDKEGEVFDACGAAAFPGLIDAHCHLGLWEEGAGFEGDDGNEDTDPCTPQLRAVDGIKIDRAFAEAAAAGVTTAVVGPGSANPIAGQICALKTVGNRVDSMLLRAPLAIKMALGENPKNTYHDKQQGPVTRMGIAAIIRDQLAKAVKYKEQQERATDDEDYDEPEYDAKCEALLPLLRHEMKAHIHAHTADDLFTAVRIAKEFDLEYVLVHATGGHRIAKELAEEGASVVTGPLIGARTKPELSCSQESNPGDLARAGVQTAICTDHPEVPAYHLMLSAKLAVEAGMDELAALQAVTTVPARICGLEKRIGSLEAGKDADIVLYRQHPMRSAVSRPFAVWINGIPVQGKNFL